VILVVFYSHTGATRRMATLMADYLSAGLCELVPDPPYGDDYRERAKLEKQGGYGPKLQELGVDLADYDTIFVGSPNWFSTYAPPVTTFLQSADLAGKVIGPFCTHGSGGVARVSEAARLLCPRSTVLDTIGFYRDATMDDVESSLAGLGF
jgi:flavodoxin